jgi:arylsulfatase
LLRENGYHIGHVGKWGMWDFPSASYDFARQYEGRHWYEDRKRPGGRVHVTKRNEEDAIEFLTSRPRDRPFCLTVAFFATHAEDNAVEQYKPMPESMHLYVNDTVPLAPSATQEAWEAMPYFFNERNEGRVRWRKRFDEPEKFQTMMKNYFRMATEVDSACNIIVEELNKQGILNSTLVIFTTDNGYFHSEHMLADKFYPHQESIRVPLIIRDPRMSQGRIGTTNSDFTLSIDLAPTILSAAKIIPPLKMQGRDISVLYRDDLANHMISNPWRTDFYYELPQLNKVDINVICPSEALVRKDFKLINWTHHMQEQLFDLQKDPWEIIDVINNTQHQLMLIQMRERLRELREFVK